MEFQHIRTIQIGSITVELTYQTGSYTLQTALEQYISNISPLRKEETQDTMVV